MPQLAVGVDFLSEFPRLQLPVQRKTIESLTKFQEHTHAGAHLEKLVGAKDDRARTIRIDKFWRGVVIAPDAGDRYVLLRVMPHDDAITWARSRRFTVNEVSGVLEVRDVEALDSLLPDVVGPPVGVDLLFAHVGDGDLLQLGVDDQVRALARTMHDESSLDAAAPFLPEQQSEVLYALASGMTVQEVWADVVAPRVPDDDFDTDDLAAAAERTQGRIALVDGPDELLDLFDMPLALWRVFLHPSQERVAYRPSFWGSAQVTGGPGTGKTVVALHRVRHLVRSRSLPAKSVLVTTYTKGLAHALDRDLAQLLEPTELKAVQVTNVDKWAMGIVRGEHGSASIVTDENLRDRWQSAAEATGVDLPPAFLDDEWRHVVLANDVHDVDGYLASPRRGRGRPLPRGRKEAVWATFEHVRAGLRADRLWTWLTLADEAAQIVGRRDKPPFRHVVVDEIQDLHPSQWRLLRAAAPIGPDDLFLTGDPHQRIYGNHVSLRRVGVHVAGRSTRLKINYRTSAEILAWSMGILAGEPVEDLDDSTDTLNGYRSDLRGADPDVVGFGSAELEANALVTASREWLELGVGLGDIAVVARTRQHLAPFRTALTKARIPFTELGGDAQADAVSVGTMHGMKGLEFRCVAVVGAGRNALPLPQAVTPASEDSVRHAADVQQERCLAFVACTRARERLRVSWHGRPSELLPITPNG